MPRIYTSASEPIDFCKHCFPPEDEAEETYGDVAKTGRGPDERWNCFGWDAAHPPYEGEHYLCEDCGVLLAEEDN